MDRSERSSSTYTRSNIPEQMAYARQVNKRSMARWQESQDPQAKLQFMTMGKEFTFPYNMTQLSYMSLNHMRELRGYYRKIMYEMPQFTSMPFEGGVDENSRGGLGRLLGLKF